MGSFLMGRLTVGKWILFLMEACLSKSLIQFSIYGHNMALQLSDLRPQI